MISSAFRSPQGARALLLTAVALCAFITGPAASAEADRDDRVATLERQVAALRAELAALSAASAAKEDSSRFAEIERRLEILAAEIEKLTVGEAAVVADASVRGLGPAASKIYRKDKGVSIGGYGELLYQNFDDHTDDGADSGKTDQFDFLRAVLYFGYKFNDKWLLNTELEYEHASTSQDGEVSVEFAYLDYLARPAVNFRAGLLLVPMGFINELHEPTVFLGSRRPDVEWLILPTTWRENGVGLFGEVGPVSYRTYLLNGLDGSGFSAAGLRGGRQKGSKAKAEDLAWVGRLDYHGTPGLTLGGSAYVGGSGQDLVDAAGDSIGLRTVIVEGHVEWRWRALRARVLGVRADLDDVADLNAALGLAGAEGVGERLTGGYVELGYDLLTRGTRARQALVPFVRWESYDTQDRVPDGFERDPARSAESLTVGLAYQPIDPIVFKLDYQNLRNDAGTGIDQLNVAIGYIF